MNSMSSTPDYFAGRLPVEVSRLLSQLAVRAAEREQDSRLRDVLFDFAKGKVSVSDLLANSQMEARAHSGVEAFSRHIRQMSPEARHEFETRGLAEAARLGFPSAARAAEPGFLDRVTVEEG